MASIASGVGLRLPQSVSTKCCSKGALFAYPNLSLTFHARPQYLRGLASRQLKPNGAFGTGLGRLGRSRNPFVVRCDTSSTERV